MGIRDSIQFVREAKEELRQVTWPNREEVTSFTVVVVITVIVLSLFLWGIDTVLLSLIKIIM